MSLFAFLFSVFDLKFPFEEEFAFQPGDIVAYKDDPKSEGVVFFSSPGCTATQFYRLSGTPDHENSFAVTKGLVLVRTARQDQKEWNKRFREDRKRIRKLQKNSS